jgi:transposase
MRKAIDGLAALVEQNFKLSPYENSLFLFCGRRRDRIKALYWESDGFLLLYKRLESGSFQWPNDPEEVKTITKQELRWLLEGLSINQPKAVKKLKINPKENSLNP